MVMFPYLLRFMKVLLFSKTFFFESCCKNLLSYISTRTPGITNLNAPDGHFESIGSFVGLLAEDWGVDTSPNLDKPQDSCITWTRQARVSVQRFFADFQSRKSSDNAGIPLLEHFAKKLDRLQMVKFLPDLLELQEILLRLFRRKMERPDASVKAIGQFLIDVEDMDLQHKLGHGELRAIKAHIETCKNVWIEMKEYLTEYALVIPKKDMTIRIVVPSAIRELEITDESPLELLLPSAHGQGLCAYVLVEFLMRTQNEFLEEYSRLCKLDVNDIPTVHPKDVTCTHVIRVNRNTDLLPLILSNCKYAVNAEKGQAFEYDLEGIERQLKDQFISGRSHIEIKQIPTMMYRSETAETWSHRDLVEIIPQVPLSSALKKRILNDFTSLPRLFEALDTLDMTISLLCCLTKTEDNSNKSLSDFLTNTLRIPNPELGQQVERTCKFKHVLSLWFLLSMKKDDLLQQNKQNAFQFLDQTFLSEKLSNAMEKDLKDYLRKLPKEKQGQLTETLYECIVIRFVEDETDGERLDYTGMSVFDALYGHVSAPFYDNKKMAEEGISLLDEDDEVIMDFPQTIKGTAAVAAWILAMEFFKKGQ